MGLDVRYPGRVDSRGCDGALNDITLTGQSRCHRRQRATVVVDRATTNDSKDLSLLLYGVAEPRDKKYGRTLRQDDTIRQLVERTTSPRCRKRTCPRQSDERRTGQVEADPADEGQVTIARRNTETGLMKGRQRGRTCGVDDNGRTSQPEMVCKPRSQHVRHRSDRRTCGK